MIKSSSEDDKFISEIPYLISDPPELSKQIDVSDSKGNLYNHYTMMDYLPTL